MARQIRRFGPMFLGACALVGLVVMLAPVQRDATAATFTDPWWDNDSPSIECHNCGCGCPRPAETYPIFRDGENAPYISLGVSRRTGEAFYSIGMFNNPSMTGTFEFALLGRGYVNGATQVGNGFVLSCEFTVEENIINTGDPDALGGTEVYLREAGGGIVTFVSDGDGGFTTTDCSVRSTLTKNSPYKLTDEHGNEMLFDSNGMPDKYTDRNGNETDYTYNSSYQITGLTDDRGGSWTFTHDTDGFLTDIEDPSGREWSLDYDTSGNLETIDSPTTTQQTSGITITLEYDGSNRLTGIEDGRALDEYTIAYVGSTAQVDKVTVDGTDIDFTYSSGQTDITDRNGNVHRTFYTGQNITKTDMYISSQSEYATN